MRPQRAALHGMQAKLLEHNVRFGDPECQCLMLRLQSDLLEILMAACSGALADVSMRWANQVALTVIMAAKGYPGAYKTGTRPSMALRRSPQRPRYAPYAQHPLSTPLTQMSSCSGRVR